RQGGELGVPPLVLGLGLPAAAGRRGGAIQVERGRGSAQRGGRLGLCLRLFGPRVADRAFGRALGGPGLGALDRPLRRALRRRSGGLLRAFFRLLPCTLGHGPNSFQIHDRITISVVLSEAYRSCNERARARSRHRRTLIDPGGTV